MKFTKGAAQSGPSSALGIMRFFDTEAGGPKLTPEFVIVVVVAFAIGALVLQMVY